MGMAWLKGTMVWSIGVHWPIEHVSGNLFREESEGRKGVYVLLEFRQEQVFSSRRSKIRGDHLLLFTQDSGREKPHLFLLPCK